ncbi:MAG: DUF4418 family protein [Oscillospiraceae bacterium]|nr:DUF4418 family protein [Oscillospiraceae bacterium]
MKKILQIILLLMSAALCAGVKLVFHACAKPAGGMWMHCHDAENAVCGIAAGLAVLSLLMLLIKNGKIAGCIGILTAAGAAAAALVPGHIVKMCMMDTMRCHAVMKPAVIVFSVLIALLALCCAVLRFTEKKES